MTPNAEVQEVQIQALTNAINKLSDKVDMLVQKLEEDYATKTHVDEKIKLHETTDLVTFNEIKSDLRFIMSIIKWLSGVMTAIILWLIGAVINSIVPFIHFW